MAAMTAVRLPRIKMSPHLSLSALWAVPPEKRKKAVIVLLAAVTLLQSNISAQVVNDNIHHRLELPADGNALVSNTTGCTVQWACVDQSLTGKCIQYHNDQWFFFHSGTWEKLFLNISNQHCRDDHGVQVVVLRGTPCEPATYEIIACVSPADQDDFFIPMDSLAPHTTYLVNVDGYLHDFCRFRIAVGEKPYGLPIGPANTDVSLQLHTADNRVEISWQYPAAMDGGIYEYEIYRRKNGQPKSTRIVTVTHEKNAYGISKTDYSYCDTLGENGTYHYKVMGTSNRENRMLLGEKQINIESIRKPKDRILVSLEDFEEGSPLRVLLLDRTTQKILFRQDFSYWQQDPEFDLLLGPYLSSGVRTFEVVVVDLETGRRKVYFYDL